MATIPNEQFLFSCINNSNGGTVDWAKVAEECGIVSKGAASIKYKRMKDKFGTVSTPPATPAPAGGGDEETPKKKGSAKKTPTKKEPAKKGGAKKRKLSEAEDDEATPVKAEDGEDAEATPVKAEPEEEEL